MNERLRKYIEMKLNYIEKMPRAGETFSTRQPEQLSGRHGKHTTRATMKKVEKFLMSGTTIGITSL